MNDVVSLVLGAIQGLTEFIPVSSSGHLVIAEHLFGTADHTFLTFVNIGTLIALLVYYRRRLVEIAQDVIVGRNFTLLRNILLTSIPAGLVGLALSDFIDHSSFFTNIFVVLTTLTIVGILMIVLEKLPRASEVQDGAHLSWQRAFMIGVAQMFALIPGVSRSGSTIITGRLLGLRPAQAADYSFLASIPIMLAVTLKLMVSGSDRAYFAAHMPAVLISNVAAFIVGLIAIRFLLAYLKNHDLKVFGWYRVGFAGVIIAVLVARAVLL